MTSNSPSVARTRKESAHSSMVRFDISTMLDTKGLSDRSPIARDKAKLPSTTRLESDAIASC